MTCTGCGEDKPEDAFYPRTDRPLGRYTRCKACMRKRIYSSPNRVHGRQETVRERKAPHRMRALRLSAVDACAVCPSGTLVLALLGHEWSMREIAEVAAVPFAVLRATVTRGQGLYAVRAQRRADPVDDAGLQRLAAMLAVAVGGKGKASAEAEAWALGCAV